MCNRYCLVAAVAFLLVAVMKVSDVTPPFHMNALPVQFEAGDQVNDARDEVVIDRKFKVSDGENLRIDIAHSNVVISNGSSGEAGVRVVVDGDRAKRFFEHLNFSVEKSGDTIVIKTDPRGSWNRGGGEIDVLVTVPERFNLDADIAHGDLEIDRLDGTHDVRVAHSDFWASSLTGSSLTVTLAHGDFDADRIMSEKVAISSAHGDIVVGSLMAAGFEVDTQHGDIEIERAEGIARVSGAHSDIEIRFAKLNGGEFSNAHGDIEILAPAGAAADVDFSANEIDIASGHGFVGTIKDKRAQGRVSGGGPKLVARTTHGDITLGEL